MGYQVLQQFTTIFKGNKEWTINALLALLASQEQILKNSTTTAKECNSHLNTKS